MQLILSSPPPTQILTKINGPKDLLHLPEVTASCRSRARMSPLTSSSLRPQRPDTDPGGLHHGRHGGVLRAAHRRGQGSIPGADEPEQRGAPLQRHHAGLQTHLPERGFPGTLERCRSRAPLCPIANGRRVTVVLWFLQARCPTSPGTHWSTARSS